MFNGRLIKQVWSFRRGQEYRTIDRINNFLSKITNEKVKIFDDNIGSTFSEIYEKLKNEKFTAWLIKNTDSRSEVLYAIKGLF